VTAPSLRFVVRRFRADERGAGYIAAFIVLFATLTLAGVGVLVDSARIVAAERQASSAAYEAARAGAQAVQLGSARNGAASIDTTAARSAATRAAGLLLAGSGATLRDVAVTSDEVIVTVTHRVHPWFPVIPGRTVIETGRARLVTGITQEGQ
jgi:Flp pilus assembly protein TadG